MRYKNILIHTHTHAHTHALSHTHTHTYMHTHTHAHTHTHTRMHTCMQCADPELGYMREVLVGDVCWVERLANLVASHMLVVCPTPFERSHLLRLLHEASFGEGFQCSGKSVCVHRKTVQRKCTIVVILFGFYSHLL